jgi:hypothetical protein
VVIPRGMATLARPALTIASAADCQGMPDSDVT